MPHLTLEYSGNLAALDTERTLVSVNAALVASGHFEELDVKSRALRFDDFVVGTAPAGRAFMHAKLALLSGRSPAVKSALSSCVLEVLKAAVPPATGLQVQLCVECLDMDRDSYAKAIV